MTLWKWVAGVGTATVGIIAAPVADSLVKEGKFPDGLGAVLFTLWGWLSGLFTVQVSFPLWLVLLAIPIAGIGLKALVKRETLKNSRMSPITRQLYVDLALSKNEYAALEVITADLKRQLAALEDGRKVHQAKNTELEAEIVSHRDANAQLKQQLDTFSQSPKEAEVEVKVEMPALAFKVVAAIAMFTNKEIRASLAFISTNIGMDQVETHASIDVLRELQIVRHTASARGSFYNLTSKGRAYYLEQKSKQAG